MDIGVPHARSRPLHDGLPRARKRHGQHLLQDRQQKGCRIDGQLDPGKFKVEDSHLGS